MNKVHAIILAGGAEFGRCPVISHLPVCLWPVLDLPALVRTLIWLETSGVRSATICLNGDQSVIRNTIQEYNIALEVDYLPEEMPLGTAGCIREVIKSRVENNISHSDYLICKATMVNPPDLTDFVGFHRQCDSMLTMSVNYLTKAKYDNYEVSGTHLCNPDIIDFIPKLGYCDIKERLVPDLVQKKHNIRSYCLDGGTGSFRDGHSYFRKITSHLENGRLFKFVPDNFICRDNDIFISPENRIDDSVKLIGPLIIMDNVTIGDNCIISGPGIIGSNSKLGSNCFVEASILWQSVSIGNNAEIRHCLLNNRTKLASNKKVAKEVVWK
ncbi:MAG: NDP-sugar synthase [Sedimentisphaerales bacterium]|nr:NDP-sugar synthase [Sedimentisphaerales bacterium]MBN2843246.1 NDP-sugar synthase [Sedimentisphaerales bacterium]